MSKLTALDVFIQLEEAAKVGSTLKEQEESVRKKAISLTGQVSRDVAAAAIIPITSVKHPIEELTRRAQLWRRIDNCRMAFLIEGNDGMIITNDTIYPVSIDIDLSNSEDCNWALDNERSIVKTVAESFVINMEVDSFDGHVMLFVERGFSGDMKYVVSHKREDLGKAVSLQSLFSKGGLRKRKGVAR